MKKLFTVLSGVLLMNIHAHSQTVNARLDLNQGIANGSITATSTPFDIGSLTEVLDENTSTLGRSFNINPMVITLSFSTPIALTSSKILSASGGEWTVEGANTLSDLNNHVGTYRKPIDKMALTANTMVNASFSATSVSIVRLTALRDGGDNYVHIYDWELFANQTLSTLSINKSPYFIFKTTGAEINPAQNLSLKLQGTTTSNVNVDIPSGATWTSSNNSVVTVNSAGVLNGISVGSAIVTASYLGINTTLTVNVVADKNGSDLSVQYIKRVPEISYVTNSSNPAIEGWPAANSTVMWRAYVKSWYPVAKNNVSYKWLWNGVQIATGTVNIPARGTAYVDLPRTWTFDRNELTFVIDANNAISELTEANNQVLVYTNSISMSLTIEQSLYDYFHKFQSTIGSGNPAIEKMNSFEDWAQNRHVKRWNKMFADAIYPETPNGVLDRIRLDNIIVVPDNGIPLVLGPVNYPNINDKTIDLQWGFPYRLTGVNNFYADTLNASDNNPFYFEGSLLHELGHGRYLIDEYGYDVNDVDGSIINIKEDNTFIAGSAYMPKFYDDIVHLSDADGLMDSEYTKIDRHSAAALNLIAGHRAVDGNSNPPGNLGVFMNDLPAENRFTLKDSQGNLLTNASVKIYQTASKDGIRKYFDDTPELILTTDANGKVLVGKNPFQIDNYINLAPEGILLVRVETATQVGYEFFESSWFNLAYWSGHTTLADYDLVFDHLITKTTTPGINGYACVTSGRTNTYFVSTEFNNPTSISWWIDGNGTIQQDPLDAKKVAITMSVYNPTSVYVNVGINYPTAPWYQTYKKQVFINSRFCMTNSRMEEVDSEELTQGLVELRVFDFSGKELLNTTTSDVESFLASQTLTPGLYLMKVTDKTGTYTVKIAK